MQPSQQELGRVLLVDDDRSVLETSEALLSRSFDVVSFVDPIAALEALRAGTFDALCTDYKMPGMTGVELIIRSAELPNPPYPMLVTAYADYAMRDKATLKPPPFLLLLKPYGAPQLREMVQRCCQNSQLQRQLAGVARTGTSR